MNEYRLQNWILKGDKISPQMANVPGSVIYEAYTSGYVQDVMFGKKAEEEKWIFEEDWTYETVFSVSQRIYCKKRIKLCFDGIDTLSEITLNGKKIGSTDNMFLGYSFDVKDLLKEKDNILQVKIFSSTNYIRENSDDRNFRSLFNLERLWIRKTQCSWGWDWAPTIPNAGIWLPVYLKADDGVCIENIKVKSDIKGNVSFFVTLDNDGRHIFENEGGEYRLKVQIDGRTFYHTVNALVNIINLKIDDPKLWWPNGYGEQNLYSYSVELEKVGEVIDEKQGEIGIREITLSQDPVDQNRIDFAIVVNGRKIFCKGSNWVPTTPMTGTEKDSEYEKLLSLAKDAGYCILRVWGGGKYEKDIFYSLCDRLGIMLWQDFMFACSAIPAEIGGLQENFLKEAEYQIKRLRNHPSIALWSGGNEYYPHLDGKFYEKGNYLVRVILRGLCGELDGDRIYLHNSPTGLDEDEWRVNTGDAHMSCMDEVLINDSVEEFRKVISSRTCNFLSESALLGPTRLRSIRKFIPKDDIWPTADSWDYHFLKNPYSSIPITCLEKEKIFARKFFGEFDSVQEFLKKGMMAHAELMRGEIDYTRVTPLCRGFMNWMYNDTWGCGTWSVVDYYFERKPAYYTMKRCFAPIYLPICESVNGIKAGVTNDTEKEISGELICRWKALDGRTLNEKKFSILVGSDSVQTVDIDGLECDYISLEFIVDGKLVSKNFYFPNLWKDKSFITDIDWKMKKVDEGIYKITVKANAFARAVFVDTKDNEEITYSDNFFDMEKGDEVEVVIKSNLNLKKDDIKIKTFADVWKD